MQRPSLKSKLSLNARFKSSSTNGPSSSSTSINETANPSPKRSMAELKPALVLKANVLKVGRLSDAVQLPPFRIQANGASCRVGTWLQRTAQAPPIPTSCSHSATPNKRLPPSTKH
ncbi:uncharacterized protein EI97DRAFT_37200 [Westerdykella ornata]|uniref:Uncharacterized protein n=1 Tax=Westerdykella ornata TaxID=318751 RepID=A0A6A6JIU3_WESOR|nr:uncharacterized protein EI97DRAFT_37200 [Westerdykella ornata]KAF2276367.1 hypothetical protein EI97DRAFT_37200 [Westerdykella ornata]